jgi:hypothetical protein
MVVEANGIIWKALQLAGLAVIFRAAYLVTEDRS